MISIKPFQREGENIGKMLLVSFDEDEECLLDFIMSVLGTGRVFSKEQIYDVVWHEPYSGDYNIVMSHISHIREKIEDDPQHPVYIQIVWGVGYKFNEKAGSE